MAFGVGPTGPATDGIAPSCLPQTRRPDHVPQKSYWTYYALKPARTTFHRKLIECLDTCFRDVPALAKDKVTMQRIRAKGGCCRR